MPGVLKEFRDFLMRGNIVALAVAFVIGVAFAAVVTSFVDDLVMPVIAMIFGKQDFSDLTFTINGSHFRYGLFINALISFVISATVVYFFVVKPFSTFLDRYLPKKEIGPTRSCPECLSDIPAAARRCSFCTSEVEPAAA